MFQEFLSRIFSFFKAWGDFRKKCKFFLDSLIRDTFLCSRTSVRTVYFKLHQSYCRARAGEPEPGVFGSLEQEQEPFFGPLEPEPLEKKLPGAGAA